MKDNREITKDFTGIKNNKFSRFIYDNGILCFIVSFIVPVLIMLYAFAQSGIHPFGDRQMLVVDCWHQYYPFFRVEREKLLNGGSFLYSWQNGMGTNFMSLISYYSASPLNLLSIFFDDEHTRDAFTYILLAKIGFCGAFCSCFLRYTYKQKNFSVCMFSTMFALCSYMLGYYWNVMWFDTIALFPLVMTGIVAICRERKWKLFTFSLALSLISSYYIGYFTCIFCIFMFASAGIIEPKGIKDFFKKLFIMVRSSLLGIALSAFMTLPAYFGLKLTYSANNVFPKDTTFYEKWTDLFANLLSFNKPVKVEGLPNFACGMFAVFLFGVFVFSNGIKILEKLSSIIMLALIVVSCNINKLNYIWHGFHFTNQIPYRFAYIFCFVLIVSAFRAYDIMLKKNITLYQFLLTLIAPAIIFWLNYHKSPDDFPLSKTNMTVLLIAVIVTIVITILSVILKNKKYCIIFVPVLAVAWGAFVMFYVDSDDFISLEKFFDNEKTNSITGSIIVVSMFFVVFAVVKVLNIKGTVLRNSVMGISISCILAFELIANTQIGVQTVDTSSYTSYPDRNKEIQTLLSGVRESDTDLFYRTEMTGTYTLNDSALYGYYGISQFSSSANVSVTRFMRRLGLYASEAGNRYYYRTSTPVVNSLLGLKYIISKKGVLKSEEMSLEMQDSNNGVYLYRNKYPLSLGFMMNDDILEIEDKNAINPFEYQNNIIKLATGSENPCFVAQPVALVEYKNMNVTKKGYGNYSFTKENQNLSASAVYSFDGVENGYLYGYATNGSCDKISVKSDMEVIESNISIEDYPIVFPMGNGQAGSTADVEIFAKSDSGSGSYKLMIYALKKDAFEQAYNKLADEQLNITSFSDNKITGDIDVIEDGILYLSIPYEKGWTVRVDGEKAETTKVLHSMSGVELSAGHHTIELEYIPEGLVTGIIVSVTALALCLTMILIDVKRRKKKKLNEINGFSEEEFSESPEESQDSIQEVENEKPENNDGLQGNELPRISDTE